MSAKLQHRLAKYIAICGHCSRRAAERLITQGRVSVNGAVGKHTDTVSSDDVVIIDQLALAQASTLLYLVYHKPVGVDCNNRPEDPSSLYHLLRTLPQRVFAVGRLDKDSSGLLLLTNDGALCQQLMHPSFYHEKAYQVQTDQPITAMQLEQLASGVSWRLGTTQYQSRPCKVVPLTETSFDITLTQGLHRQIRYMCKTVGLKVIKLQRYRIHNLLLGDLAEGELRRLSDDELTALLAPGDNIKP
ncbi:pseudouridine synthase [Rheinheimera nanhaiensis]|uniref:Pseudouridine synthase n=1 Tax=Rheinheimera nanhaiensis E407-8 TaxID=562729 RepID=I1DVG4_9GAMM|nr:pseudouridine synthase [Rheinheimera nanhaiensis]GAB58042.1 ribosomal large subunit pseudouridine synthase F [Rheinheimera nanhaiensis E407-8]